MAEKNNSANQPGIDGKRPWVSRTDVIGALFLAAIFLVCVTVIVVQQSRTGNDVMILRDKGFTIDARVNINSAPKGELMLLPGIGKKRAQRIIEWRKEHGRFSDLEQVRKATRLSAKACAALADMLTFGLAESD